MDHLEKWKLLSGVWEQLNRPIIHHKRMQRFSPRPTIQGQKTSGNLFSPYCRASNCRFTLGIGPQSMPWTSIKLAPPFQLFGECCRWKHASSRTLEDSNALSRLTAEAASLPAWPDIRGLLFKRRGLIRADPGDRRMAVHLSLLSFIGTETATPPSPLRRAAMCDDGDGWTCVQKSELTISMEDTGPMLLT